MDYTEVCIEVNNQVYTEILEAEFAELPFESFDIHQNTFKGYIQTHLFNQPSVDAIVSSYSDQITSVSINEIAHQNWNKVWESNYPPVQLDNELFIGATFHEVPEACKYAIILEPNMSFGTGHHPTTEMMLRAMFSLNMTNWNVMDFGCGSAILAIYAAYKNAHGIGIEIDAHAAEAARQNLALNQVSSFTVETGGIEKMAQDGFDLILANINKNVIEECLDTFKASAKEGTLLFCSGFLSGDVKSLTESIESKGFRIESKNQIEDWAMLAAKYQS